jgi:hypothetical protein
MIGPRANSFFLIAAAVLGHLGGGVSAPAKKQRINVGVARKLVYEAIRIHNAGATLIESPRDFDSEFYFFAATWPNPTGSPIIGYFAVNPWTADVWAARICERLTSPQIKTFQERIRRKLGLKEGDYRRLGEKTPMERGPWR